MVSNVKKKIIKKIIEKKQKQVHALIVNKSLSPSTDTLPLPIEYGDNIVLKLLDDKIIVSAKNSTKLREGNFSLEGEEIVIEAGKGIKISSRHPNILVIEANLTKFEEQLFDLKKNVDERLRIIEGAFTKILKQVKA